MSLLEDLRDVRALLEEGDSVPGGVVADLLDRLPAEAPGLPRDDIQALLDEVNAITALVAGRLVEASEVLERMGRGRDMRRGYHRLRGHHTAQRLNRRA